MLSQAHNCNSTYKSVKSKLWQLLAYIPPLVSFSFRCYFSPSPFSHLFTSFSLHFRFPFTSFSLPFRFPFASFLLPFASFPFRFLSFSLPFAFAFILSQFSPYSPYLPILSFLPFTHLTGNDKSMLRNNSKECFCERL
jgi:hypothetical protein